MRVSETKSKPILTEPPPSSQIPPSEDPDQYEDILVSGWFYLDHEGIKQGPFMTTEMRDWFVDGFFTRDLKVKRVYEEDFSRIGDRDEFKGLKQKPIRHMSYFNDYYADPNWNYFNQPPNMPSNSSTGNPNASGGGNQSSHGDKNDGSYSQKALFNLGGKFAQGGGGGGGGGGNMSYWKIKGLPEDREGRMMGHYFDVEQYQESMRNMKQNPPKKRKVTKKMIQYYKKKKEDKKKRRILMI